MALNASHRDGVGMLGSQTHRWWRRDAREGRFRMTIDRQPHRHLESLQALQVATAQLGFKLSSEIVGVLLPALKDHSCPRIRGQCFACGGGELSQVLVGQDEIEPIPACLGEHIIEALRKVKVVLELVQVQVEVGALFLGAISPMHCDLPEARHDERPQQSAGFFSEQTLR